jgi:hypothetical protein
MADEVRVYGAASISWQLRREGAPSLVTVRLAVDEGAVGMGGSGARYVTSTDGSRWVVKTHIFGSHQCLCMNEAVSSQIAQRMELRIPEPAVLELDSEQLLKLHPGAQETDRFFFASRRVEDDEPLSPAAAAGTDPEALAGIVVLDALVRNTDQKPEHLLAQPQEDGTWRVLPIDYGHALAVGDTVTSFDPSAEASPIPQLLQDHVSWPHIEPWIATVRDISRHEFQAMVEGLPTPWVFEPDAGSTIADALLHRVQRLPALLRPHLRQ